MRALVTGGGGFLGRRVVELLLQDGHEVRFLARSAYPEVEALGATGFQADLRDTEALGPALQGIDTVFHVASMTGFWEKKGAGVYWAVNVDGTNSLLGAMEAAGVPKLVYTSTPSVVGYERDIRGGGQDLPYPDKHLSIYPESKAAAEREVLSANSRHMATVALRPHLIFGPRDNHLIPRFIERASQGSLPIVGEGTAQMDLTFVDNAAWAHLDAAKALTDYTAPCAGRPYFISNDEPVVFYEWLNEVLIELGHKPVSRRLPLGLVRGLGRVLETLWDVLPLPGEPRITPFIADGLARHHWYDMEPAKRDLGYRVRVPMAEATRATVEWIEHGRCIVQTTEGPVMHTGSDVVCAPGAEALTPKG